MTVDEIRPTLGERYGLATHTSNLRVHEKRTDADFVIAAGLVAQEGPGRNLGVLLLRVQSEFDGVRAALNMVGQETPRYERMAKSLEKRAEAWHAPLRPTPEQLREAAEAYRNAAAGQALTERLLAMMDLKSLREAKQALGVYANILATKQRFMEPPAVVDKLAGRVLDVFLDPTCHTCSGTGQIGSGYMGDVMRVCVTCGGTAHRRDSVGNGPRARWFAFILLGDMQREMAQAAAGMARRLRKE